GPQGAEAASLEVGNVDETNEVYAVLVEAVPAAPLGVLAVALEVSLARALIDDVVLAGHIVHVKTRAADDLIGIIELLCLGEMGDVTGMEHERGFRGQSVHPPDGLFQGVDGVRVCGLVEADVA